MLTKYEMSAPQSEMEKCDTLRYTWERLQSLATKVSNHLLDIQPGFKEDLIQNVTIFKQDCKEFYKNYDEVCPLFFSCIIIIIKYIYHALINALSAHMIHINLNMIFCTHVEHSSTKTIYIKYYKKHTQKTTTTNTHMHAHTHSHTMTVAETGY